MPRAPGPPVPDGRTAEVELDLVEHRLAVRASDGAAAGFALRDRLPCAEFYADLFAAAAATARPPGATAA